MPIYSKGCFQDIAKVISVSAKAMTCPDRKPMREKRVAVSIGSLAGWDSAQQTGMGSTHFATVRNALINLSTPANLTSASLGKAALHRIWMDAQTSPVV